MRAYIKPLVTKFSTGKSSGLDEPTPLPAVETIGAKRSRKKSFELSGAQDTLNSRSDTATLTGNMDDSYVPKRSSSSEVHDIELSDRNHD